MRTLMLLAALSLGCKGPEPTPAVKAKVHSSVKQPGDSAPDAAPIATGPVIDHEVQTLEGETAKLSDYRGKAMLIVNTASECGSTPQYADLQAIHAKYRDRGLVVLGFPSNDFGEQEPGTHEQIREFVTKEYGVEFPMFAKVKTKGDGQAPLYRTLTEETDEGIRGEIKWNFTKFLVDPQGRVVERFNTRVEPTADEVIAAIERTLPPAGG